MKAVVVQAVSHQAGHSQLSNLRCHMRRTSASQELPRQLGELPTWWECCCGANKNGHQVFDLELSHRDDAPLCISVHRATDSLDISIETGELSELDRIQLLALNEG
jgi:hypothetical protein